MAGRKDTEIMMGFMTHMPSGEPAARSSRGGAYSGRGSSGILDESKITSKGQLTLPKTVRTALGVAVGDTVRFVMQDSKIVVETVSEEPLEDPAVMAFLDTLEGSIHTASEFPVEMMEAMKALTADIEVDLDAPIEGDVVI
ncbi:type II toxin-antitoxin system PrlF family antitoxin [Sulfitobacter sp. M220]|uniref:type II toxin-antitoxin system PrlF family antitoxin n=1 Tax=Sulfitobacter sp. M220 TaxID=2675333 RepID=UPI001F2B8F08|nr:type II toxin-antitoxin system PrlF family antitoxin [Sulfitobacter sp. M220]